MKHLFASIGIALLASAAGAETLSISCGAVGAEFELCKEGVDQWALKTGNKVNLVSTPNSSTERLSLYQQLLTSKSQDLDVLQIDVVWPGMLASHLLDLTPYVKNTEQFFPGMLQNLKVGNQLTALPWFTDAGMLYYRKDLLEKYGQSTPVTWEELTASARLIQDKERKSGHDQMWGYVWQGRAYEGLTCDALEWVYSYNGGTLIDSAGKVDVTNAGVIKALDMAKSWVKTISPEGVLNYAEEEARGVFQSGNAVFMRSWPYAWNLAQAENSPIKGKVGIAALPMGGTDGQNASTLGGWQLAVSKYTRNPALAADLVQYLTSYEEQKRRVIKSAGGYNPTIPALYQDDDVIETVPQVIDLYYVFANSVPRPSTVTGDRYGQVSNAFFNSVHSVLSGSADSAAATRDLQRKLTRIMKDK